MKAKTALALRLSAMLAVGVGAGVVITGMLLPKAPPPAPVALPPTPVVRVAGFELSPKGGDPAAAALDLVRRYTAGELRLKLPDGTTRSLRRASLGVEIDRAHLATLVRAAFDPKSAMRRAHDAARPGEPLSLPLPVRLRTELAVAKLVDLKVDLDKPASDAFVDVAKKKLEKEKIGYRLDVYGTLARLDAALRSGAPEVEADVERVMPRLLAEKLGNVKFDQVLGWFETRYSASGKGKERTYNLRLAASKLDGTVLMPGEVFDFNGTVGPRDEAHGYRVATVIAEGELVDGLGGGTCQISGTLHGAALFAGLDIVERYRHSRPSYYIKLGLDATVVYPNINFRFRNPFDFPVVLHETVAGGVVRAEILGPSRKHTVTWFRRVDEVVPYEEVERPNPRLPEGSRVLAQRGIPGFKTSSSRVVRDGAYAVREKWTDTYPPTAQIVHVGTGPSNLEVRMRDDAHPEYVVDHYLVVTQGPDVRSPGAGPSEPGGGMVEAREPGKTGEYGWTSKLGMPTFDSKGDPSLAVEGASADKKRDPSSGKDGANDEKGRDDGADKKEKTKKKKKKKGDPEPSDAPRDDKKKAAPRDAKGGKDGKDGKDGKGGKDAKTPAKKGASAQR